MTKKFYFFILIFISLNLNAQVDFKGVWQGVIMMYGQSMEEANTFYLNIETNGKASEGKTREEVVNSPYYCIKKTSYTSKNNELKLSQKLITKKTKIPTIGIGSSSCCDGQILVTDDMLGLSGFYPKFVKKYANLNRIIEKAVKKYTREVKLIKFPSTKNFLYGRKRKK